MSVLYEVNIKVADDIYDAYLDWLQLHVEHMLEIDGFEQSFIYTEEQTNEIIVHYFVSSRQKLEDYFNNHAQVMRQQAKELFGDQFSITRRILTMLSQKERV